MELRLWLRPAIRIPRLWLRPWDAPAFRDGALRYPNPSALATAPTWLPTPGIMWACFPITPVDFSNLPIGATNDFNLFQNEPPKICLTGLNLISGLSGILITSAAEKLAW